MTTLIISALIAFIGLFLRGLVGFGSSLIMTPLLLLVLDVRTAVVAAAITQTAVGVLMSVRVRQSWDTDSLIVLLPISIVGITVGSVLLAHVDSNVLKRIFGAFTILFSLRIFLSLNDNVTRNSVWPTVIGYLAGLTGGIMGGVFGTSGPPIVAYLENRLRNKEVLWATLLAYFAVVDNWRLINYALHGLASRNALVLGTVMVPAGALGAFLGARLTAHTNETAFRSGIGLVLLLTGILLVL